MRARTGTARSSPRCARRSGPSAPPRRSRRTRTPPRRRPASWARRPRGARSSRGPRAPAARAPACRSPRSGRSCASPSASRSPRGLRSAAMELLERVAAGGLLEPGAPAVVLLSGGRDSVCLLDVAVALCGAPAVRALHVNYGLRDEAAGDEAQCRALCERLGVELGVERADRPDDAPGNLQAWARDLRYAAGARLAAAAGGDARVAAAHTATDQAETILYRL